MNSGILTDITSRYTSADAFFYDRIVAPAVAAFEEGRTRELVEAVPEGGTLLDVGCGGGHLLVRMGGGRPDLRLTGIDLSPDQVARARERLGGFGDRVRVEEGSALDLPFPEASFDAVVSVASIKHWPDPARGLAECVRVLRPGGRIAVVEADRGCRFEDARAFVSNWNLPFFLKPLFVPLFRTYVAGQSLDLTELRELAAALPLSAREVERIGGTPAMALFGTK